MIYNEISKILISEIKISNIKITIPFHRLLSKYIRLSFSSQMIISYRRHNSIVLKIVPESQTIEVPFKRLIIETSPSKTPPRRNQRLLEM